MMAPSAYRAVAGHERSFGAGEFAPGNAWQVHATPFLRWWISERFFIEGGIGVTAFNKTRFADKTINTRTATNDQSISGQCRRSVPCGCASEIWNAATCSSNR